MTNAEEIGFHKGALATLLNERKELAKMINVVDQLIQGHVKALKKAGVDVTAKPEKSVDDELESLLDEQA